VFIGIISFIDCVFPLFSSKSPTPSFWNHQGCPCMHWMLHQQTGGGVTTNHSSHAISAGTMREPSNNNICLIIILIALDHYSSPINPSVSTYLFVFVFLNH